MNRQDMQIVTETLDDIGPEILSAMAKRLELKCQVEDALEGHPTTQALFHSFVEADLQLEKLWTEKLNEEDEDDTPEKYKRTPEVRYFVWEEVGDDFNTETYNETDEEWAKEKLKADEDALIVMVADLGCGSYQAQVATLEGDVICGSNDYSVDVQSDTIDFSKAMLRALEAVI